MKKLAALVLTALAAKVLYELYRSSTAPPPQPAGAPFEPAPRPEPERTAVPAEPAAATADEDDLTAITGVGPAYASRLNAAGITGFASLAAADVVALAERLGMSADAVADWQRQAQNHIG